MTSRAVILAAGMGSRMRRADGASGLDARQAAVADTGVKALMPIDRPFLDYVLDAVVEAGVDDVCLVIGPGHHELRAAYAGRSSPALRIAFAVQARPLGTADALRAAEAWAGDGSFLMLNSDNHYPADALRTLRAADGPALVGFDRDGMLAESNIPADRITKFAAIERDAAGRLKTIHEKPSDAVIARLGAPLLLSMNCWKFSPVIFAACAAIAPSPRGELEITDAAQHAIDHLGERFAVCVSGDAVLDLSSREDVAGVTRRLAGRPARW